MYIHLSDVRWLKAQSKAARRCPLRLKSSTPATTRQPGSSAAASLQARLAASASPATAQQPAPSSAPPLLTCPAHMTLHFGCFLSQTLRRSKASCLRHYSAANSSTAKCICLSAPWQSTAAVALAVGATGWAMWPGEGLCRQEFASRTISAAEVAAGTAGIDAAAADGDATGALAASRAASSTSTTSAAVAASPTAAATGTVTVTAGLKSAM